MFTYPQPKNRQQKKKLLLEVKPVIRFASELEASFLNDIFNNTNENDYNEILKIHNIKWITYCGKTQVDFIQLDPYWFIGKYKEPMVKKSWIARVIDYIRGIFK